MAGKAWAAHTACKSSCLRGVWNWCPGAHGGDGQDFAVGPGVSVLSSNQPNTGSGTAVAAMSKERPGISKHIFGALLLEKLNF